jgi:hypothetical protein
MVGSGEMQKDLIYYYFSWKEVYFGSCGFWRPKKHKEL